MHFSELISALQNGQAGLQSHHLGNDPEISSGASIDIGESNQISFLEKGNVLEKTLQNTRVGAVLLPSEKDLINIVKSKDISWAILNDPRLGFAETLDILHPRTHHFNGIHPSAVFGNQVKIGEKVSIGANVYIGDETVIGNGTVIYPGVVIYEDVVIGEHNEIHANSVIHRRSRIGKNCILQPSAIIGSEGFGFIPTSNGWKKMPQTGFVVLEDHVEVGACTTIDRPCVGQTLIGEGSKIDNLVQIGHGVTIGQGCAFASQVGIAGGAQIGNGVILAGQVGVANRANVGDNVVASSKTGLHGDIDPNQVLSGFPALPHRLWLRCATAFSKLPEMAKILRELKSEVPK